METKIVNVTSTAPAGSPAAAGAEAGAKMMKGKSVQMTINDLYEPQGAKGMPMGLDSMFQGGGQNVVFPVKPVHIGDSWSSELDLGKMLGGMFGGKSSSLTVKGKIPLQFKLLKISGAGPKSTALVGIVMKGNVTMQMGQSVDIAMDGAGTFLIDIASGMTIGSDMKMTTHMGAQGTSMAQKMSMSLKLKN